MPPSSSYEPPEQGYYQLRFVQKALADRLTAIENAIPPQARVLDVGCNDGRIARHLLARGLVKEVTAVDLSDMILDKPDGLSFIRADLLKGDFKMLPASADVVLFLNVAHHLVCKSPKVAKAAINHLLSIAPLVLLDMGSFSEHGDWQWRRAYERHWQSDGEMWADLFAAAASRWPLLLYPAQNGGQRVLWQLTSQAKSPATTGYHVLGCYRRTVSSIPHLKRLVKVSGLDDKREAFGQSIGQLCPEVVFYLLEGGNGKLFWSRKWLYAREWMEQATLAIEAFLGTLGRENLCLAVDVDGDFGMVYPFHEDLFASTCVVHQWDTRNFFNAKECAEVKQFAATPVKVDKLPWRPVGELTDFQIARTRAGLQFLDFEPAPHIRHY